MDSDTSPDFLPTATLATLQQRARLRAVVRRFFDEAGYWEVETPILSHDIVVDAWLEPFVTHFHADPVASRGAAVPLYLQTSPEFGMKRLLAAGATAIYQVGKVFRNGESGRNHNPEFTMIEWYRVGDTHLDQMDMVERLVQTVFAVGDQSRFAATRQRSARPDFLRLTYDDAFERFTGTRVLHLPTAELPRLAERHGIVPPPSLEAGDRDGWLNFLLAELVEPHLGRERPTFLYDYPASQSALARVRPTVGDRPAVAERFELYVEGVELCNGYHELTDPRELRRRIDQQSELRRAAGLPPLPRENRLLAAMEAGLPACAGVALGFDRLVMLALGHERLADVIAFPYERA